MKKLRIQKTATLIYVMLLSCFIFTGCGDKDDEDNEDNNEVKVESYKECPDDNHPHAIDLGLPSGTKWACCNVGSSTPEGYGGYYAWGETNEKNDYSEDTYTYYNKKTETYNSLGKDIAGTDYDVAHVKWGGNWKMPTSAQIKELVDKCTWTSGFKEINGIKGCVVTGPNGGSIFLPVAGYRDYSYLESVKSEGYYLSSTLDSDGDDGVYFLFLDLTSRYVDSYYRYNGYSVRPVTGH